jgi:hypothetical protein
MPMSARTGNWIIAAAIIIALLLALAMYPIAYPSPAKPVVAGPAPARF